MCYYWSSFPTLRWSNPIYHLWLSVILNMEYFENCSQPTVVNSPA